MSATSLGKMRGGNARKSHPPKKEQKNDFFTKKSEVPRKQELLSDSDEMEDNMDEQESDSRSDVPLGGSDDSGNEMSLDIDELLRDDFLDGSDDEGQDSGSDSGPGFKFR